MRLPYTDGMTPMTGEIFHRQRGKASLFFLLFKRYFLAQVARSSAGLARERAPAPMRR
jgi:hypothetical protein